MAGPSQSDLGRDRRWNAFFNGLHTLALAFGTLGHFEAARHSQAAFGAVDGAIEKLVDRRQQRRFAVGELAPKDCGRHLVNEQGAVQLHKHIGPNRVDAVLVHPAAVLVFDRRLGLADHHGVAAVGEEARHHLGLVRGNQVASRKASAQRPIAVQVKISKEPKHRRDQFAQIVGHIIEHIARQKAQKQVHQVIRNVHALQIHSRVRPSSRLSVSSCTYRPLKRKNWSVVAWRCNWSSSLTCCSTGGAQATALRFLSDCSIVQNVQNR